MGDRGILPVILGDGRRQRARSVMESSQEQRGFGGGAGKAAMPPGSRGGMHPQGTLGVGTGITRHAPGGLGRGVLHDGPGGREEMALPAGVYEEDVRKVTQGMRRRRSEGREHPTQLSLYPGAVVAHYGPGA